MKTYNVEGKIKEWVKSHCAELYEDILTAAENPDNEESDQLMVCSIRSITGVTDYVLKSPEEVVRSLRKVEMFFASIEEYEKAARARDCGLLWKERTLIYRKNT